MALADKFKGKVAQTHYRQPLCKDSQGTWWGQMETQSFEFEGCTYAEAHTTTSVTVTDVGGGTYTFTPVGSFTDGSTGSAFFASEEVKVDRKRVTPHMWALTVTRTGGALYCGTTLKNTPPSWMTL